MAVIAVNAGTPEGRAIMQEAFGLSPLRRAEIRRSQIVGETDRAHPFFGGLFAGRTIVPDEVAAALDAEIAKLKAPPMTPEARAIADRIDFSVEAA